MAHHCDHVRRQVFLERIKEFLLLLNIAIQRQMYMANNSSEMRLPIFQLMRNDTFSTLIALVRNHGLIIQIFLTSQLI